MTIGFTGGGGGVDWSSKTPKFESGSTSSSGFTYASVSGSGYIIGLNITTNDGTNDIILNIDSNKLFETNVYNLGAEGGDSGITLLYRFDSSFEIKSGETASNTSVGVNYVLD